MTDFAAHECENGHLTYPAHTRCPACGRPQTGRIDLSDRQAEVVTWTTVMASPTGVREPNTVVIVEFTVDDRTVRAIGSTTAGVSIGDTVRPVHVEQLRDPSAAIRVADRQSWSGYRFEPVD